MGEFGDVTREFKEAKPAEKTVIIVGILAVVGIVIYIHIKNQGTAPASGATGNTGAAPTSGWPSVGANNTPVLPPGVNPVYDPGGNLIAFQPGGSTNGPLMTGGGTTPTAALPGGSNQGPLMGGNPSNWYTNLIGKIPYGAKITPGGLAPQGQRFWYGTNSFFYAPAGSTFQQGGAGRIWLNVPGQNTKTTQGTLITGPGMIPAKTMTAKVASGGSH